MVSQKVLFRVYDPPVEPTIVEGQFVSVDADTEGLTEGYYNYLMSLKLTGVVRHLEFIREDRTKFVLVSTSPNYLKGSVPGLILKLTRPQGYYEGIPHRALQLYTHLVLLRNKGPVPVAYSACVLPNDGLPGYFPVNNAGLYKEVTEGSIEDAKKVLQNTFLDHDTLGSYLALGRQTVAHRKRFLRMRGTNRLAPEYMATRETTITEHRATVSRSSGVVVLRSFCAKLSDVEPGYRYLYI